MKSQRKSIVAILLLMLAFNLTATALSVQALDPGVGKYLTIEIVGEGNVTVTKVKSGEYWEFSENGTEKVGAGTVLLEAFPAEGYRFVEWIGDVNPDNTYKTEKYGVVIAVFEVLTYTITAYVDLSKGYIDPGNVTVTYGVDVIFTFGPNNASEDHVSTILVDGQPPLGGFLDTYTFEHVTKNHTIHVIIDPIGTVSVPAGPGGSHNVDEFVGATVDGYLEEEGVILGYSVIDEVVQGMAIRLYVIAVDLPTLIGEGVVFAFLVPDGIDPLTLTIIKGDTIEAVCSDVNRDAQVDGTDVSIVANAIKFKEYYPWLDLDGDEELTEKDIKIINENKGAILVDVTGDVIGEDPPYFLTTDPIMDDDPPFSMR